MVYNSEIKTSISLNLCLLSFITCSLLASISRKKKMIVLRFPIVESLLTGQIHRIGFWFFCFPREDCYFIYLFLKLGATATMLRAYSWPCNQESILARPSRDHIGAGIKLRQAPCLCTISLAPGKIYIYMYHIYMIYI